MAQQMRKLPAAPTATTILPRPPFLLLRSHPPLGRRLRAPVHRRGRRQHLDGAFLSRICRHAGRRVAVLALDVPTPAGLMEALGPRPGHRVLCPVSDIDGLREPPVVPDFLAMLEAAGWVAVRAPAYTTCWAGSGCASTLVAPDSAAPGAIVFDLLRFRSCVQLEPEPLLLEVRRLDRLAKALVAVSPSYHLL